MRRAIHLATLGLRCHASPVATLQQLVRRLLAQVIQLADGQELSLRERGVLEIAQHERRLAKAAELLAQRCGVERAPRGRCEVDLTAHRDLLAVGGEHRLERRAGGAEEANVHARLSRAKLGGQRRVARSRALEQRRFGRSHDTPSVADGDARRKRDRLADDALGGNRAHRVDGEADRRRRHANPAPRSRRRRRSGVAT